MPLPDESLQALLSAVARFVSQRLVPLEDVVEQADRVPPEVIDEMRQLGLFGLSIPEAYGGLGLSMEEEVRVAFELGRTSPAFRSVLGTNNGIGSQGIVLAGTEAQKQLYLPKLASGELIGSFALTEPEAGSDAGSLRTSAVAERGGYVLNGTKRFITNAPEAGLFTVFARTSAEKPGAAGVSAFLVEAGTPGISIGKPDQKMGQRGAHTADVSFDACWVRNEAMLGAPETGFRTAMKVLDRGRLHISAVCVGVAERLLADSLKHALAREQFGKPIAEFQLIQAMLADSHTEAYAARSMILETARKRDSGSNVSTEAACSKLFASEMVGRVADRAVQIHGGAGYMAGCSVERFYRDVRLFRIYEGTSQIQQLVIAKNLLRDARGGKL